MLHTDDVETEAPTVETETPTPPRKARAKAPVKARANGSNGKAKSNGKAAAKAAGKAAGKAPVKAKGKRKARTVDPAKLDQFGFRKGSLKSRAAAMYASKKGATLAEVKDELESTQFNLLTELEEKGFKVTKEAISGGNDRKVTRYKIIQR